MMPIRISIEKTLQPRQNPKAASSVAAKAKAPMTTFAQFVPAVAWMMIAAAEKLRPII